MASYRDEVGHPGLARALDEFATNWKRHRSSIVAGVRGLAAAALAAATGYERVDERLAGALAGGRQ